MRRHRNGRRLTSFGLWHQSDGSDVYNVGTHTRTSCAHSPEDRTTNTIRKRVHFRCVCVPASGYCAITRRRQWTRSGCRKNTGDSGYLSLPTTRSNVDGKNHNNLQNAVANVFFSNENSGWWFSVLRNSFTNSAWLKQWRGDDSRVSDHSRNVPNIMFYIFFR